MPMSFNSLLGNKNKMDDGEAETMARVFSKQKQLSDFAGITSLHAIPYVISTKRLAVQIFWILVFIAATIGCGFHLSSIYNTFIARDTTTSVKLGYAPLAFPSVTFCNVNPLRFSKKHLLSQELKNLIAQLKHPEEYEDPNIDDDNRRRKRAAPVQTPDDVIFQTENYSYNNIYDVTEIEDASFGFSVDDFGVGTRSARDQLQSEIEYLIGEMNRGTRREAGHQLDLMLLECSYNGKICDLDDLEHTYSKTYGNCFTYNSPYTRKETLRSRSSGSRHGLSMILYSEDFEYIDELAMSRGFRIHIHPFNTYASLVQQGLSLETGKQTYIGMKMLDINRMQPPYGDCDKQAAANFEEVFNHTYTIEACNQTCTDSKIASSCDCLLSENWDLYSSKHQDELSTCGEQEMECVRGIIKNVSSGIDSCTCAVPCKEVNYEQVLSYNIWPHQGNWFQLVDRVCDYELQDASTTTNRRMCRYLRSTSEQDRTEILRENFLNLNIFYQDLNFETIVEQAEYDQSQFLSDFGGTVGLWIGASVITALEVVDVIIKLFYVTFLKSFSKVHKNHSTGVAVSDESDKTIQNNITSTADKTLNDYYSKA